MSIPGAQAACPDMASSSLMQPQPQHVGLTLWRNSLQRGSRFRSASQLTAQSLCVSDRSPNAASREQ